MPIEFTCPRCQTAIQVPDESAGKKGRCPNCQGKVRVPTPPLPEIEFRCPQCAVAIRVPGQIAGRKIRCPHCQVKLRVPAVAAPPVETFAAAPTAPGPAPADSVADEPAGFPTHVADNVPSAADQSVPNLAPALGLTSTAGPTVSKTLRRRQKSSLGALVVPFVCLSLLSAIGVWFFWASTPKLEGTLTAERLTETELPTVLIDPAHLNLPQNKLRDFLETLAKDPLRVKGSLMRLEIRGGKSGVEIIPEVGTETVFYRVNLKQDKFLWKHLTEHRDAFDKPRQAELAIAVPEFVRRIEQRQREAASNDGMSEFRTSVGVNSLVKGIGYQLQAVHRGEGHRCVYEDHDGRAYFLLPRTATSFELSGRPPATKSDPHFSGRYDVTVRGKGKAK